MREYYSGAQYAEEYRKALIELENAKRRLENVGTRAFCWAGDEPFDYEGELKAAQAAYDAAKAKADELGMKYYGGNPVYGGKTGITARVRGTDGWSV